MGGGFSGRRSEPPARHQPTTYNATGPVANEEYHSNDHSALCAITEPIQPLIFDETLLGADGDEYNDCVVDDPSARVYGEEFVLCARALARAAPADSDAHLVCAPPEILVPGCTPNVLDPALDAKKLLALLHPTSDAKKKELLTPLASPLDCFKDALTDLLCFFAFG